ncbi:uncharacterized protein LOC105664904 isoform X2 [Ceratitis capitata]|uniref:uncharacterized protein LOC105664904 isoform X2 n=1 Tax=Ceratitis capitata TaxID=7213 RepID=UPI000A0FD09A|nr:uncharacterized protein LOC105664904 isoform X2 [Ceratitis capitata]
MKYSSMTLDKMTNSTIGLITTKNATNFKLHSRTRRHKQYVTSETEISCFHPMGLNLDADENCNFVRQNYYCNFNTKLINYLEFAVCTMRIDNYPCIIPNLLTLLNWCSLKSYQYGVIIVSILMILPNLFMSSIICNAPKESYSTLITELSSKTFTMYGFGMALIAVNKNVYTSPLRCVVDLSVILLGNIYIFLLIHFKTKSDNLPKDEQFDLKLGLHAKLLIVAYSVYLFAQLYDPFKKFMGKSKRVANVMAAPEEIEGEIVIEDVLEEVAAYVSANDNPSVLKENFRPLYGDIFGKKFIVLNILCAPIWFVLTLLIPVINENLPFQGWHKYLLCVNLFFISLPLFGYIQMKICFIFIAIGFLLSLVLVFATNAAEPPSYYKIFSIFGLFTAFMIYHLIVMEIDTIIQQCLQYAAGWNIDAVTVISSSFSNGFTEIMLIHEIIKCGEEDIAFGLVIGLVVYNTLGGFPVMLLQPCFDTSSIMFLTNSNSTLHVFLFMLIAYNFFALVISNFELRRSYGVFLFIFCCIFFLFIILIACECIHSYGSQHSPIALYETTAHANWS